MARFKDCFFGKLVSAVNRYGKQPYRDWQTDFVGQEGLIILYESEHKAPGKVFFHIQPVSIRSCQTELSTLTERSCRWLRFLFQQVQKATC